MSYAKFAPITSSLLARKGEAGPSLAMKRSFGWATDILPPKEPIRDLRELIPPPPVAQEPLVHDDANFKPHTAADKPRRIVVGFSPCEFERLGIAAVKKGLSRHDLVRETMNAYLHRLSVELNSRCACLNASDAPHCNGTSFEA